MTFNVQALTRGLRIARDTQILSWLFLILGVLILGSAFFLQPAWRGLSGVRHELAALKQRIDTIGRTAREVPDIDGLLTTRRGELENWRRFVLRPDEQDKFIAFLTEKTGELGISILNINAVAPEVSPKSAEADSSALKPSRFQIEIECSYKMLGVFFERLLGANLLLVVEEFEARSLAANPGLLNARIKLAAYLERMNGPTV